MVATTFGRMCRTMIRVWPQPMARAASTKECWATAMVVPRITRELVAVMISDEREDHVQQTRSQDRHHRQDDDQVGKRQPGVDHPLDDQVVVSAEIAAGYAERGGHQGGQADGQEIRR